MSEIVKVYVTDTFFDKMTIHFIGYFILRYFHAI